MRQWKLPSRDRDDHTRKVNQRDGLGFQNWQGQMTPAVTFYKPAFSVLVTTHNIWTRDREDFPLTAHDVRTVSLPMAASTAFGAPCKARCVSAVLLQWLPQDIGSRALEACDDRLQ